MASAFRTLRSPAAAAVLLVAAVYLGMCLRLEKGAFWVIDNANKFLQMQAIEASGGRDFSIPWPGRALDPEFRWSPLPHPFGVVENGRLFSFYPPTFAALAALPHRALGAPGLFVLPLLGALALLAGVARSARTLGADARAQAAAVLVTGLCTPVWFYSEIFWEHVPAAALALWGSEGVLRFLRDGRRRDLVRGCALAALSVYLRDELYLFCGVLAAVATLGARSGRAAAAATAGASLGIAILPLWAFQAWALGHPLGIHLHSQFATDLAAHFGERLAVLQLLFLASVPDRLGSLLLVGPVALALVLAPRVPTRSAGWLAPVLAGFAALGAGVSLAGYARAESAIGWMLTTNGLLATTPVLALAGFRFAEARDAPLEPHLAGWLRAIALGYAGLYALVAPLAASAGVHWGNRFLLVLYPLLALLAGPNLARWLERFARPRPAAAAIVAAAALVSLGAQAFSIRLLAEKLRFSVRLAEAVARHPELPIATGIFWVPQELFRELPARPVFLVDSQADLRELAARLRGAGYPAYLFVTDPGAANAGNVVERVEDPELGFYAVDLVRMELRP